MTKFIITSDTGSDLTVQDCAKLDVYLICLKYRVDDEVMQSAMSDRQLKSFYESMKSGAAVGTSAPNIHDYISAWTPFLEKGLPILHLALSSGISSACQNAMHAAELLKEDYENAEITVVDSLGGSLGQYLLLEKVAKMRKNGATVSECADWLLQNRLKVHIMLTTQELTYLYKGGRVSRAGMTVAHALGIMPVMGIDSEGKVCSLDKVRGKPKTFSKMVDRVAELCNYSDNGTLFVAHAANEPDARLLAKEISKKCAFQKVEIRQLGPVIGAHAGPGLVTVIFMGAERSV